MASEPDPHVNDDDVETPTPELTSSVYSQLVENYSKYLRGIVAGFDGGWQEGLRPQLNSLIHAMEKEAEVP